MIICLWKLVIKAETYINNWYPPLPSSVGDILFYYVRPSVRNNIFHVQLLRINVNSSTLCTVACFNTKIRSFYYSDATSGARSAYRSGTPEFIPVFSGIRVTRSLVLCVCFVDYCLSFCTFSFCHCVVCPSSVCGFWLPLWYLQTLLEGVIALFLVEHFIRIIFKCNSS